MAPKSKTRGRALKSHFGRAVTIVKRSQPKVVIVTPKQASNQGETRASAEELQHYLYKVSKAEVPLIGEDQYLARYDKSRSQKPICIGPCAASRHLDSHLAGMKNDGYVIAINTDSIHILGSDNLATRFGVYGFLEDYIGIRWFLPEGFGSAFPENMGTYLPQKRTIILHTGLDVQEASFKYRYIGRPRNLWTRQNKMNCSKDRLDGYTINKTCHSFTADFIKPSENSSHPEYFATVDGQRMTCAELENEAGDPAITSRLERIKLNVGNLELRLRFAEQVRTYIAENPEVDIINLFPSDGRGFDESADSTAMDGANCADYSVVDVNREGRQLGQEFGRVLSKRYTMFYHDVLDALVDGHEKIFMTGAYSAYQYAPLEVGCPDFVNQYRMHDKVILLITHSWEHNHPIGDRNTLPNINFAWSVDGWGRLYAKLGVYEYYYKHAMCELPFPIIHAIRHDIPYYHRNRFEFFYTQYNPTNLGTYGLNHYIAAKLLWNVNAEVDKLLDDFFAKFYGPAAIHMKEYHETLENAAIDSDLELSPKHYGAFLYLFNDHVLDVCHDHLADAKDAASGSDLLMARIALTENSFKYTQDVMDYLKAIKAAISNRPYWEIVNWRRLDLSTAEAMADEIKGNIGDNLYPHAARETNYTNRLFSVNGETVRKVRDYFYGNGDRYAKAKWLQMNNVKVVSGYGGHERFDIWIYAYDIDFNVWEGPEHQVNLIKKDGTTSELGRIARNRSEAGNEIDKGFLLQNYSFEDLIGDDEELTIEVYNFPGGRSSSKLYAIAIMPHVDTTTQDDVTWYYQNDIEFIRRTSTGFVEFRKRARSSDEERFQTTIRLYAA